MKRMLWIGLASMGLLLSACSMQTQQQKMLQGQQQFQEQDYVGAYKTLKPLAEDDNADAQYALGYMYYYGKGVPKNYQEAMYWMTKAANQGQPLAKQALSQLQNELNAATQSPLGKVPSSTNQVRQTQTSGTSSAADGIAPVLAPAQTATPAPAASASAPALTPTATGNVNPPPANG